MKKLTLWLTIVALVFSLAASAAADTYSFSAAQVKSVMQSYGAPLSNDTYLWGLWAVRTMPIVTCGTFTITGGSTNQEGWGVYAPSTAAWYSPYGSNCAWFWDKSGAYDGGGTANPLYMITNQPASNFTSYFGNTVTEVNDASTFTVNFTLDPGATWNGLFQFVVDGSKYNAIPLPGVWNANFYGGSGTGGGLTSNMGAGYQTPLPGTLLLLGSGLTGLVLWRRRKAAVRQG